MSGPTLRVLDDLDAVARSAAQWIMIAPGPR